jgi:hypothetical protein
MRRLVSFLLAMVFLLHTTMVLAAPVCTPCPELECPVSACADMGCLPSVVPGAPSAAAQPGIAPAVLPAPLYASAARPAPLHEIWTPPD